MWNETGRGLLTIGWLPNASLRGVIWAKTQWIRMNQKCKDGENILGNDNSKCKKQDV